MRRTRLLALPLAAAAALAVAPATPTSAAAERAPYAIDSSGPAADNVFPEGVATDERNFYVGSTTDGTIYRGELGGTTATPFLLGGQDGRTSAVGLKVSDGFLFVAGGATGRFFIYDVSSGELVGSYQVSATPTFLNDVAVAPDGTVYVTDSMQPFLYRVSPADYATDGVETFVDPITYAGTDLVHQPGAFNVNGIVAEPDGAYLVIVQSNTRTLFRVDLATEDITAIDLHGDSVGGDGLVLLGRTLYAVERVPAPGPAGDASDGRIVEIRLSDDVTSGSLIGLTRDETFDDPTTAAFARGRLLVVNSQFGERSAGVAPSLPFTVSSIPLP